MKKVEAIIRQDKLDPVVDGLDEMGYPGITVTEVKGHGKQKGVAHQWRGTKYMLKYSPKIKVEVVVLDEDLEATVSTVMRNSRTGSIGDGKIFVINVEDVVRVRTGDSGLEAI